MTDALGRDPLDYGFDLPDKETWVSLTDRYGVRIVTDGKWLYQKIADEYLTALIVAVSYDCDAPTYRQLRERQEGRLWADIVNRMTR